MSITENAVELVLLLPQDFRDVRGAEGVPDAATKAGVPPSSAQSAAAAAALVDSGAVDRIAMGRVTGPSGQVIGCSVVVKAVRAEESRHDEMLSQLVAGARERAATLSLVELPQLGDVLRAEWPLGRNGEGLAQLLHEYYVTHPALRGLVYVLAMSAVGPGVDTTAGGLLDALVADSAWVERVEAE